MFICEEDKFLSISKQKKRLCFSNKTSRGEFSFPYKSAILWRHFVWLTRERSPHSVPANSMSPTLANFVYVNLRSFTKIAANQRTMTTAKTVKRHRRRRRSLLMVWTMKENLWFQMTKITLAKWLKVCCWKKCLRIVGWLLFQTNCYRYLSLLYLGKFNGQSVSPEDQKVAGSIPMWGSETFFWVCD